jgi:hypothetical protein
MTTKVEFNRVIALCNGSLMTISDISRSNVLWVRSTSVIEYLPGVMRMRFSRSEFTAMYFIMSVKMMVLHCDRISVIS